MNRILKANPFKYYSVLSDKMKLLSETQILDEFLEIFADFFHFTLDSLVRQSSFFVLQADSVGHALETVFYMLALINIEKLIAVEKVILNGFFDILEISSWLTFSGTTNAKSL